jgi:two-component system sensor histidine kinase/response regulator
MRILLIDDSAAYCEEFAELLAEGELAEATLDCVSDAAEGARVMNRGEHSLYVVDYRLPGRSGIELIRHARAAGVAQPIICLTGFDSPRLDQAAEAAGATAYLPKGGFSAVTLSRTIRYALRATAGIRMPQEAESRFALAQETVSIGTWEWDVIADEMSWDRQMYQLFGCAAADKTRHDLRPREIWRRALTAEALAEVERALSTSLATGAPLQTEFTIIWGDGSEHYLRTAGRVSLDPAGRPVRMIGITWDITEVRDLVAELAAARHRAEQASLAKSRLLAGVSHELRTPLNGILGHAHLLRIEGGLSEHQCARVETMLNAGAHLLDLINRVLDLSSIEADSSTLHPAQVAPRAIAESCLDVVRPEAEAKSLRLLLRIAAEVPGVVTTDPTRLRQILLNLLGNAVKFTRSGTVELVLTRPGAKTWRAEVIDTGPGIPAEQGRRLFQEFQRLHTNAPQSVEGSGLGLALASRLVALLGGRLGYLDNPAGGSRFWFELPVDVRGPGAGASSDLPDEPATLESRCLRILVVDDVAMNRDIAQAFLRSAQHEVITADSGAAALAALAGERFDVVLMDVCMPDMDGLEATRRIRASAGTFAHVPIVALTAHAFAEQIEECRHAGMTGHLTKPFTPAALQSAVLQAAADHFVPDEHTMTSVPPLFGADLPIVQADAFERTASCLPREALATYLQTLVERSQALLQQLRDPEAAAKPTVTVAAHALAGSAGMFGFERLSVTARHFEHAAGARLPQTEHLTQSLIATTIDSVSEMQRRLAICGLT